jgi:hypothetical protein
MEKYAGLFKSGLVDESVANSFEEIFNNIKTGNGCVDDYSCRLETLKKNPERNINNEKQSSTLYESSITNTGTDSDTGVSEYIEVHTKQDITIYSGSQYICKIKNIFNKIWVDHICFKKPEWGIWGVGMAEELDIAHYYINVAINQEADVATLENFPMYTYDPNSGNQTFDGNFMSSPSKMIAMDPNSIRPLAREGTLNLSYKIIDFMKTAAREGVGIDDTTRGSQLPSSTVATQINAIRESTNRRINSFLFELAEWEQRLMHIILKQGYVLYPTITIDEIVGQKEGWFGTVDVTESIEYMDFDIPVNNDEDNFYKIEKEAFNPKGYWKMTPSMSKAIEFSREAELRNLLSFVSEMNKLLANDVVAKSLQEFDFEPVLQQIVEKYGMKYSKVKETGNLSPKDIKDNDAMLKLIANQEGKTSMDEEPNMLSQLPDVKQFDAGQNLSTLNQIR